ncbi:MAG TPA: four helix bundle protein [Polyangiaceae bacterium]|nr:four helix bundle protein [Polyangiaceae bacterium]
MTFRTLELALSAQRNVAPLVARVQRHDRKLAAQLRDATNSFVLNLGEGSGSDPGNRRSRYFTASGSAREVVAGLRAGVGWGYLSAQAVAPALAQLDQLLGALWKLTH